ncbi:MAG: chorismate-binding protein, partial [Saezia sp.]
MGSVFGVFDTLIAHHVNFALYRMPGQINIQLVLQLPETELVTFSDFYKVNGQGFLMAPFQVNASNPIALIQPDVELTGVDAISRYAQSLCESLPATLQQMDKDIQAVNSGTQEHYRKAYAVFHHALEAGHFSKLVLSRTKELFVDSAFSAAAAFERACTKYPNNFIFLCHTTATGTWMGSTPELLISGSHGQWGTVALAGTQSVAVHVQEKDVQWDDKNRLEQQIVVDYIRDQLQALDIAPEVKPVHTVRSGGVVHLKSEIVFGLPECVSVG